MKIRYLFLLLAFCFNTSWADFSNTQARLHPLFVGTNEPFIVDLRGEWPTDCHPGEQKPVISEYTGDTALIEFETIVEHVTCNNVVTPYRVLVDMSDVIGSVEGEFRFVDIIVRFGGDELEVEVPHPCIFLCSPVPLPWDVKPEAGLYFNEELDKQGLILARQNQRMGVYPLIYDQSGSSEWLFGGGGIVEDTFFTGLFELTGGQCLGCLPPSESPQMNSVGKLTMLMDSEGLIQVKVNDGLFKPYQPIVFGYGEFEIVDADDETPVKIPDLSGRWAFSKNNSHFHGEGPISPTSTLPLVFDVTLSSNFNPPVPVVTPPPRESVLYSLLNMEGEQVAEMLCAYSGEMVCDLKTPGMNNFDDWYSVNLLSPERMVMTDMAPIEGSAAGTGTAVRID